MITRTSTRSMKRWGGAALAVATGALVMVGEGVAVGGAQVSTSGTITTRTFDCTGERQEFVVPAGVSQIEAQVYGAQGGTPGTELSGTGGPGAAVTALLYVEPGSSLYLFVGCYGERGPFSQYGGSFGGSRGGATGDERDGGGGGGSSEIWSEPLVLPDGSLPYLVVAGGGGGGGGAGEDTDNGNIYGGGGGGSAGTAAAAGEQGTGNDASAGGLGGCNVTTAPTCGWTEVYGGDGEDGGIVEGGGAGGGGGGSSIAGGSGGRAGDYGSGGGGGAAGASGVDPSIASPFFDTSLLSGDGQIALIYQLPEAPPPPPSEPLAFVSLAPERILDTRDAYGDSRAGRGVTLPGGQALSFDVRGRTLGDGTTIPADAEAVMVNLTVTEASEPTFVTLYPSGTVRPEASTINAVFGTDSSGLGSENVANMVTVRLGTDGAVGVYNHAGTTHVIADIAGYYIPIER